MRVLAFFLTGFVLQFSCASDFSVNFERIYEGCSANCENTVLCKPSGLSEIEDLQAVNLCRQFCVEYADEALSNGEHCYRAYESLMLCVEHLDCAEFDDWADRGDGPYPCSDQTHSTANACPEGWIQP